MITAANNWFDGNPSSSLPFVFSETTIFPPVTPVWCRRKSTESTRVRRLRVTNFRTEDLLPSKSWLTWTINRLVTLFEARLEACVEARNVAAKPSGRNFIVCVKLQFYGLESGAGILRCSFQVRTVYHSIVDEPSWLTRLYSYCTVLFGPTHLRTSSTCALQYTEL